MWYLELTHDTMTILLNIVLGFIYFLTKSIHDNIFMPPHNVVVRSIDVSRLSIMFSSYVHQNNLFFIYPTFPKSSK